MSQQSRFDVEGTQAKVIALSDAAPGKTSSRRREAIVFLGTVAIVLAVYLLPFGLTRRITGPKGISPIFAPDTYLYLTFSRLHHPAPRMVENVWYGVSVPRVEQAYAAFRGGPAMLGLVLRLSPSSAVAVPLWTAIWVSLCALAFWWFLRAFLSDSMFLSAWVALVALVNLARAPDLVAGILHPSQYAHFMDANLPWLRLLYPQVAVPLVLLYFGCFLQALRGQRRAWVAMAAVQAITVWIFPYATLWMAMTTAFAALLAWAYRCPVSLRVLAAYAAVCALLDAAILLSIGGLMRGGSSGATSVIMANPFLHLVTGKTFLTLVALTLAAGTLRFRDRRMQALVAGLGAANALLLIADAVLPVTLQVASHANYFVQTSTVILLALLAVHWWSSPAAGKLVHALAVVVIVGSVLAGARVAYGISAYSARFNTQQAALADALAQAHAGPGDLVVAPAEGVDEGACWVPFVTGARVLYCHNAEMIMTADQRNQLQRDRFATYLYLSGRDEDWIRQSLASRAAATAPTATILQITERLPVEEARDPAPLLQRIRTEMESRLGKIKAGDPGFRAWMKSYRRVLVVDYAEQPRFDTSRLREMFGDSSPRRLGAATLRIYGAN